MGLKADYYHKCATCERYGLNNVSKMKPGLGFFCHAKQDYFSLEDSCDAMFYGYIENTKVTDEDIEAAQKALKPKETFCFITTIVCEILNFSDNSPILKTMRAFRDGYLSKHEEYIPLLVQYDCVGPVIAEGLRADRNCRNVAKMLVRKYLNKCVTLVNIGKYDDAASVYYNMVEYLASRYDVYIAIDTDFETHNPYGSLGHGVRTIKRGN